ncbi:MAG: 3-deoxy-D-manno-octulosonic acid transferase [Planctomycetia bacterium]|nr:3-deoxy-D-manno-octulosonic acid transferase [Planctomycetia bacterium]
MARFWRYLLNAAYILVIFGASPFLLFAMIWRGKYREGYREKFLGSTKLPKKEKNFRVWIHAASVGEVNLAATVWKALASRYPQCDFVFSVVSNAGARLARQKFPIGSVFYAPLDFSWSVKRALRRVDPDLLILIEAEIWPNLLLEAREKNLPVALLNARLSDPSFRGYRRLKPLFKRVLKTLALVAAQDEKSAEHYRDLGIEPEIISYVGSIKYDGARSDRAHPQVVKLARLWNIQPDDVVFLAGSTQAPEEAMALEAFRQLENQNPHLRLIVVPRHPERFEEVAKLLENSNVSWIRRSQLRENDSTHHEKILLVDTVGELGNWWGVAHIAYVGGSMGNRGGQNMIEPAAYGAAVSFGPNTWNFRQIVADFLGHGAAVVVHNQDEMTRFVQKCLEDADFYQTLSKNAFDFVHSQSGALEKTLQLLESKGLICEKFTHEGTTS